MDLETYFRFLVALAFVIALIGLLAFLVKRYGVDGRLQTGRSGKRLSLVDVAPIDGKRRLVLVRRDDTEHLLLLGATGELVVEAGIRAAGDRSAAAVERPAADAIRHAAAPIGPTVPAAAGEAP
jgi:flagellar protein FliO/FliZ